MIQIGLFQLTSNAGTADTLPLHFKGVGILHIKTCRLANLLQKLIVTTAITAKTEIVPHHQKAGSQTFHQHLIDKILSG